MFVQQAGDVLAVYGDFQWRKAEGRAFYRVLDSECPWMDVEFLAVVDDFGNLVEVAL